MTIDIDAPVIAIDGEGCTGRDGKHRYTYLAACTAEKLVSELHRPKGIAAHEVFDWLLSLPKKATLVGFSLGYDQTKWIEAMRDGSIWSLMRPDERSGEHGPRAIKWRSYRVNKVSRKFSVSREGFGTRTVWDVWAFFQTSFVAALKKWEVTSPKVIARIKAMKDKRATFARIDKRERAYCQEECRLLARLVRLLLDAHAEAGLVLKELYGPGSTARIMLQAMRADAHNVKGSAQFMHAVECAFFGGRFECSRVGPVPGPLYAYDLASAYPYAWCLLPCFEHGRWKHVGPKACRAAVAAGKLVLVRYALDAAGDCAWGPLPHRLPDGNIVFPATGAGTWAWSPEVSAARALHRGIRIREGYLFVPKCRCGYPFRAKMVEWYRVRVKWGNKGRGRVLRLGMNSCTGKAMQRVGSNPFRCLVRAGLVTSLTRARLLSAIASAPNPWCVVETATDSVLSRKPLKLAPPVNLGTAAIARKHGSNPLGAWDPSPVNPDGVFLCRPGQRFRLGGDGSEEDTASRGMPVKWLHANRGRILRAWERAPGDPVELPPPPGLRVFQGAKVSVRKHRSRWTFTRSEDFGQWLVPKARNLSFSAQPKRECLLPDFRLGTWELPQGVEFEGVPYSKAPESEHTRKLREHEDEQEAQG